MQSYFLNDPSTPELVENFDLPVQDTDMQFSIAGFNGECNELGNPAFQAANVYISLVHALSYFKSQFTECGLNLNTWFGTKTLQINPRAGEQFNAYYARGLINYMYGKDNKNQLIYTADSADVVTHELGHAILDAAKPELFNLAATEVWSFHEGFSDICAVSAIMSYDKIVDKALAETNQTLQGSNIISKLAEQMGVACRHREYLRDLENNFSYVNPSTLPQNTNNDGLSSEIHSFSRIFSSVWYDIFVTIFNSEKQFLSIKEAVRSSRDKCFKWLVKGILSSPKTPRYFEAVARGMSMAAKADKSPYNEVITDIFTSRKIIPSIQILSENLKNIDNFEKTLETHWGVLVKKETNKVIKLSDHLVTTLDVKENPFLDTELEVAADEYVELDQDGNVVATMSVSEEQIINEAKQAAILMNLNRNIWSIENGRAVRISF